MRTAPIVIVLGYLACLPACGNGGSSDQQPPPLGDPWFAFAAQAFSSNLNPDTYNHPWGVSPPWYCGFVLYDANQDGHVDVALVTRGGGNVTLPTAFLLLGNGAFSFGLNGYPPIDMWTERRAAAVADFDADGWLDLVVTDAVFPGVQAVSYYGAGSGLSFFAWNLPVVTPQPPGKVVAGDWDEDGFADAAYLVPGLDLLFLLPGNGDGTFGDPFTGLPFPLGTGEDPVDLLAADLDGDGHLDLATANRGDDTVSVFLGGGDGSFTTLTPVPAPGGPRALAAADFDGDGTTDLAVACFDFDFGVGGAAAARDQIDLLLADGRAWGLGLASVVPLDRGEQPIDLVADDFDGDGDVDLAYASRSLDAVGTLENDGQAAFARTLPARVGLAGRPQQLEIGDFDADGKPDLAVFVPDANAVTVLRNVAAP
jgi:hypothetical protein